MLPTKVTVFSDAQLLLSFSGVGDLTNDGQELVDVLGRRDREADAPLAEQLHARRLVLGAEIVELFGRVLDAVVIERAKVGGRPRRFGFTIPYNLDITALPAGVWLTLERLALLGVTDPLDVGEQPRLLAVGDLVHCLPDQDPVSRLECSQLALHGTALRVVGAMRTDRFDPVRVVLRRSARVELHQATLG
jgi:hypothetical protein